MYVSLVFRNPKFIHLISASVKDSPGQVTVNLSFCPTLSKILKKDDELVIGFLGRGPVTFKVNRAGRTAISVNPTNKPYPRVGVPVYDYVHEVSILRQGFTVDGDAPSELESVLVSLRQRVELMVRDLKKAR